MGFRTVYGHQWSENQWRMCNRDECDLVRIPELYLTDTAPLRKGPPLIILGAWLYWYDRNVEEIISSVWGWSATNDVANSNHLSGTAVDVNAPKYPWGVSAVHRMSPAKIAKIEEGLRLFEKSVFWGEEWSRKDPMHYQMAWREGDPRNDAFAQKLRSGYLGIYGAAPTLTRAERYALAIINEGRRLRITPRGIKIALAVGLVETHLTMYANAKDPASLELPHDAVGSDHDSSGIYQQRPAWGPIADRMDVTKSTMIFFTVDKGSGVRGLTKIRDEAGHLYDYNDASRSPGFYAQKVQGSAFPDRYDERFAEAERLYDRLAATTDLDPWEEFLMSNEPLESVSIYATPGEARRFTPAQMLQSVDGMAHRELVENDARLGDPDAIARIVRVAKGQGKYRDAAAVRHAIGVLAELEKTNPAALQAFIAAQKG